MNFGPAQLLYAHHFRTEPNNLQLIARSSWLGTICNCHQKNKQNFVISKCNVTFFVQEDQFLSHIYKMLIILDQAQGVKKINTNLNFKADSVENPKTKLEIQLLPKYSMLKKYFLKKIFYNDFNSCILNSSYILQKPNKKKLIKIRKINHVK